MNKSILLIILLILIVLLVLIVLYNYNKSNNITSIYYKKKGNKSKFSNVLDSNPIIFVLNNNKDIKIISKINKINYKNNKIDAKMRGPIIYNLNINNQKYIFYRYPDFRNEIKRHSQNYMNNYMDYFFNNILNKEYNIICEFTSYHGVLDNKVRIWHKLLKKYGRKEASKIMPNTYLIPDDYNLFINNFKDNNTKFICKNSFRGGKSGLLVTNNKDDIIKIFQKYSNSSKYINQDNAELGKKEYNLVQKYLENPFLIKGYKFNFRFYITVFWINNKLKVGLFKDFVLSYSYDKYDNKSTDLNKVITSTSSREHRNIISRKLNRPYDKKTFFNYMKKFKKFNKNKFINNLLNKLKKIVLSNKDDLTGYCIKNTKQFQIYAIDAEMYSNFDVKIYEFNVYFSIYRHNVGKIQASLYEDTFYELGLTKSKNDGYWFILGN